MIRTSDFSIMNSNVRYIHEEKVHNFEAAKQVVPFVLGLLDPKSVVDVGCGTGTWLKVFQDYGIDKLLGVDGDYVNKSLLKISPKNFIDFDLENFFSSKDKFELAISLEVAEHLKIDSADLFIETLTNLSDTVIFSAAVVNQGGQNHINEQEPSYWINKFESKGFRLFDILRPVFWDNECVEFWYRQNIMLFTKREDLFKELSDYENFGGKFIIHPILFQTINKSNDLLKSHLKQISRGKKDIRYYVKLFAKAVLRKIKDN